MALRFGYESENMLLKKTKTQKRLLLPIVFILINFLSLFSQKNHFEFTLGLLPNLTFMQDNMREPKGGLSYSGMIKYNLTNRIGLTSGFLVQYLRLRRAKKVNDNYSLFKIPVLISYNITERLDLEKQVYIVGGYSFTSQSVRGEVEWIDKEISFLRLGLESRFKTKKNLFFIFTHFFEWSNFYEKRYGQLYTINFGFKIGLSKKFEILRK